MVRIIFVLGLMLAGCHQEPNSEQSCFYEDGTAKPVVALISILDRSEHHLPWSLSDEFTCEIGKELMQRNKLYLTSSPKKTEFAVFLELIDHKEISGNTDTAELQIIMQLRVVDLRGKEPKILIDESLHDTQYLPKYFTEHYYSQVPWGKETYCVTPLGLVHNRLIKQITEKIEKGINYGL